MIRRRAPLLLALAALALGVLTTPQARAADPVPPASDSQVTVSGRAGKYDDFANLKITVSQTKELISQGIQVSWTGGTPTGPDIFFGRDYLQMMQCWGPDPNAADFRNTCQFGQAIIPSTARLGLSAGSRGLTFGANGRDPAETLPTDETMIPFKSVTGETTPPKANLADLREFFNSDTTNEVPYARTAGDGTGQITFEVQDTTDAPALGCGDPVAGSTTEGRKCWLVIVPRGSHDPLGNLAGQQTPVEFALDGSPLSPTAFANRIVVPLSFQRSGVFCPLGSDERQTTGSELMAPAITSWQTTLCANKGPVFGFAPAGDAEAGLFINSGEEGAPSVAFVTDPVRQRPGGPPIVHAPVALSGAVIAFEIEARVDPGADGDAAKIAATQFTNLKLTPKLVAKMLTQSYRSDVPDGANVDYVKDNPASFRQDKEFLDLNPDFAKTAAAFRPDGLMVVGGNSALAQQIWEWILADDDARAWLAGKADDQGTGKPPMVVNPNYKSLVSDTGDGPLQSFPKQDPSCVDPDKEEGPQPPWCTLDLRPYLGSLQVAARQTLRGNAGVKNTWDPTATPPSYKTQPNQSVGQRFALAITDSASARRYNLPTASLLNKSGQFVAPTEDSIAKGVQAMDPTDVAGVVRTNAKKVVDGAYPLSMLTYAAINLKQKKEALTDDARLLNYAVGAGQTPGFLRGQLPPGYVPLPEAQRQQTRDAAVTVAAGLPPEPTPASTGDDTGSPGSPVANDANGNATPTPTPSATATATPNPGVAPSGAAPKPSASTSTAPVAQATAGNPIGRARFLLLGLLIAAGVSLLLGPILLRYARGRTASTG